MFSSSINRVSEHTQPEVNEHIHQQTQINITFFAGHPDRIDRRLAELDQEWDIERMLETGSSTLSLFGFAMSLLRGKRWLLLPIAVQSFFLQHAVQGWCPPLPLLRRMGFRTSYEIEKERYALKVLRGDFRGLEDAQGTEGTAKLMKAIDR